MLSMSRLSQDPTHPELQQESPDRNTISAGALIFARRRANRTVFPLFIDMAHVHHLGGAAHDHGQQACINDLVLGAPWAAAFWTWSEIHVSHWDRMEQAMKINDWYLSSMALPFLMAAVNPWCTLKTSRWFLFIWRESSVAFSAGSISAALKIQPRSKRTSLGPGL